MYYHAGQHSVATAARLNGVEAAPTETNSAVPTDYGAERYERTDANPARQR